MDQPPAPNQQSNLNDSSSDTVGPPPPVGSQDSQQGGAFLESPLPEPPPDIVQSVPDIQAPQATQPDTVAQVPVASIPPQPELLPPQPVAPVSASPSFGSDVVPPPPPPVPPQAGEVYLNNSSENQFPEDKKPQFFKSKIFVAVFVVLFTAALIIGGLFFLQNRNQPETPIATAEPTPEVPQTPVALPLTLLIENLVDGAVVTSEDLSVKGKTIPNTTVVVSATIDERALPTDAHGVFSGTVTLAPGINDVTIVVINEAGEEKREVRQVVYDNQ